MSGAAVDRDQLGSWVLMAWDGWSHTAESWHPVCVLAGPRPTPLQVGRALARYGHNLPWWQGSIRETWPRTTWPYRDTHRTIDAIVELVEATVVLTRAM